MNMKLLYFLFSIPFILFLNSLNAQVYDVGGPVSFHLKHSLKSNFDLKEMPLFDLQKQLDEDDYNNEYKLGPFRFGYEHITNYSLNNAGIWETLPNGDRVWRVKLLCPGALSVNIIFNDFNLPFGSHVHLYNEDHTMVIGAYNSENNNQNDMLGTDLLMGETMIVEYFEPLNVKGQGRLLIGMVVHGYRDINNWYPLKVNESGACNMDVICPDGVPWSNEIRSVARISNGGGLCTGSLVNNTSQDGTPYFLTANHCGPSSMGGAVFNFNYDSPICGSQTVANSQAPSGGSNAINGSSFVASNTASDFGLIELNSTPPASYNIYYSGWDNSGNTPQTAVCIHHPSGDVKKISFDDDALQSASGLSSVANSEWRIEAWERNTTTEGGSSGAGLWNENNHLIGQLHGGQATCSNSINDYYGKFSMSWTGNGSGSPSQRLEDWLDPQNSGVTSLNGYDPNQAAVANDASVSTITEPNGVYCSNYINPIITIKNNGSNNLTSLVINYDVDGGASQTQNWSGNLSSGSTANVSLSGLGVSGSGNHTFNVQISSPSGQSDDNPSNDQSSASFECYPNTSEIHLNLTFDCWGSEVSWEIVDQANSNVLFSAPSGTYADNAPTGSTTTEKFCLSDGCYDFNINDDYGDGMSGAQYSSCDVDGDYNITDQWQSINYVQMTAAAADYGFGTSHSFCVNNTGLKENIILDFNIYPNPADNSIYIQMLDQSYQDKVDLNIMDLRGRTVLEQTNIIQNGSCYLNIQLLSKGVYMVNLRSHEFTVIKKLIVK
jgi:hypothetical protein